MVEISDSDYLSPMRLLQIFAVRFVLEVLGSGGAIWGFSEAEAVGKDIALLNGSGYDKAASRELVEMLHKSSKSEVRCTNVAKNGEILSHDAVLKGLRPGT